MLLLSICTVMSHVNWFTLFFFYKDVYLQLGVWFVSCFLKFLVKLTKYGLISAAVLCRLHFYYWYVFWNYTGWYFETILVCILKLYWLVFWNYTGWYFVTTGCFWMLTLTLSLLPRFIGLSIRYGWSCLKS